MIFLGLAELICAAVGLLGWLSAGRPKWLQLSSSLPLLGFFSLSLFFCPAMDSPRPVHSQDGKVTRWKRKCVQVLEAWLKTSPFWGLQQGMKSIPHRLTGGVVKCRCKEHRITADAVISHAMGVHCKENP